MASVRRRLYKVVEANTSESDEFVPAAGTFVLSHVGGNSATSLLTSTKIIWDYEGAEELLFSTHGDSEQNVVITLTTDGVKKLAIVLVNDESTDEALGGFWKGTQD